MNTKHLTSQDIEEAARILREGGLVAFPTETVYGLGANGLDAAAVKKIFAAKGRPQDNPLILHIPSADWLERYCEDVPEIAYRLAERCWPGPLTMILRRKPCVPDATTAGLDTVGVRCPNHALTRRMIELAGVPVAAPSANRSGRPSCTTPEHVLEDMDGRIDAIVDGGNCAVGVESTILDLTVQPARVLRPGGMSMEELRLSGGIAIDLDPTLFRSLRDDEQPLAPGMKYRHYAPKADVTVVEGTPERSAQYIRQHLGEHTGVLCFSEYAFLFPQEQTQVLGPYANKTVQAQRVFDALRAFDEMDVTEIYAQCPDESGLGMAVCNRIYKAAGFRSVKP